MEQKTIKVSRKKLAWAIIILIIVGIWWSNRSPRYYDIMPAIMGGARDTAVSSVAPSAPMMDSSGTEMMYYPPDYYRGNPDITDPRQFMKTSYNADIKTRNVKATLRDVKNIVTETGGRIDNQQESEKYAYLGFVVAKDKFETFRDEVESLTYAKLVIVNVSSENLLGQKQWLEEQLKTATGTRLAELQKQDVKFGNNIDTVNGYVSVSWTSYWEMAKLLSPIHPGWLILILAIVAWKILGRFGYIPKIELV